MTPPTSQGPLQDEPEDASALNPSMPFDPSPAGERSTTPVEAYRRSVETMRDATKWIVTFVPGAGLVITLSQVIPDLAELAPDERLAPSLWLLGAALTTATALMFAVWVLAATPARWQEIVDEYNAQKRRETEGKRVSVRSLAQRLDRSGILLLYGYESARDFFGRIASEPDHLKSAVAVASVMIDFATLLVVRRRFMIFLSVGVVAAIAAVAMATVAQADIAARQDASIAAVRTVVTPTETGRQRLTGEGCDTSEEDLTVWLVTGSLVDGGRVIVDHADCPAVQLYWDTETDGVLVPAPAR